MTVEGDDIILNCRECFQESGYGIPLKPEGAAYVCPQNPAHRYVVKNGFTSRVTDRC